MLEDYLIHFQLIDFFFNFRGIYQDSLVSDCPIIQETITLDTAAPFCRKIIQSGLAVYLYTFMEGWGGSVDSQMSIQLLPVIYTCCIHFYHNYTQSWRQAIVYNLRETRKG